jgi:hypothetical protein
VGNICPAGHERFKNRTTTRAQVTAELSIYLEDSVCTKTSRRELNKCSINGKAAIFIMFISENNTK